MKLINVIHYLHIMYLIQCNYNNLSIHSDNINGLLTKLGGCMYLIVFFGYYANYIIQRITKLHKYEHNFRVLCITTMECFCVDSEI